MSWARWMTNLGGHDIEMMIDTLRAEADGDQPTCFIAYTIKGMGLPFAGHKDNSRGADDEGADGGVPCRVMDIQSGARMGSCLRAWMCLNRTCARSWMHVHSPRSWTPEGRFLECAGGTGAESRITDALG